MRTLEVAMKNIIPGELHVVVAERGDQITGIFWTRNPHQHLANLSSATHLGRIDIRPSPHAARVVASLARRFEASTSSRSSESFWTFADFEEILAALGEYDLAVGALVERAGIKLDDPVYISKLGRGVVTGFTRCGRLIVRLDRPTQHAQASAIAPRSQVKPILRAST
jgi:hypothetical protein